MCYILHDMTKKYRAFGALAVLTASFFFVAVFMASCARKSTSGAAQPAASPQAIASAAQTGTAQPTAASAAEKTVSSPLAARKPPQAPLAASLRAYGLGTDRALMPDDFDVGALQDTRSLPDEAKDILPVARRFIDGLAGGAIDDSIFDPAARSALALLLSPTKKPLPDSAAADAKRYRIGRIRVAGVSAALAIGIPREGAAGYDIGRLSLLRSGGTWYVEAFVPVKKGPPGGAGSDAFDPDALRRES